MSSRFLSRSLSGSGLRILAWGAMSVATLWSCRVVDDEMVDGADTYQAMLPDIGANHKLPQAARWSIGADSGEAGLYHVGSKVFAWVDLDTIPLDTVWVEYWRAGVREQRSAFLFKGTARLEWSGISLVDSAVVEMLRRIDPSMDSSRFDTAFAEALVDDDSIVKKYGFPDRTPAGRDSAEILRIAMVLMVREERALAEIAPKSDWALGIDTLSVHVRVRSLCEEGLVKDTSKIFPHPGRDTGAAKPDTSKTDTSATDTTKTSVDRLPPVLRFVDPAAGTVFEHFQDSIEVRIEASDSSGVDSVKVNRVRAARRDSFWVVDKVFVPVSSDGLALVAEAWDAAGNRSTTSIHVGRKEAPPPEEPYHAILLPRAASVPFDSTSVLARWRVYDPASPIDSVRIGGVAAVQEKDSIWSARVRLDSTGVPTLLRYVAMTAKGSTLVDSFRITRMKDTTGPSIQFLGLADKQAFEYTVDSVSISVKATDLSGVASVAIGGAPAAREEGLFRRTVALALGATARIEVEARDSAGNLSRAAISVTRKTPPDSAAPRIRLVWPDTASGVQVPFDSSSATLRWIVTDPAGLRDTSVRIEGDIVAGIHDTFSLRVALPPDGEARVFHIAVANEYGLSSAQSVSLARAKDAVPPVVVRKAGSRTVPFDSSAVVVSWAVTDNHKVAKVSIDDVQVPGSDGIYQRTIPLAIDTNRVFVQADDSTGNRSFDTVVVVRLAKDTTPPALERMPGTESKAVNYSTESVEVSWRVTDRSSVKVTIGGTSVVGRDGIYTSTISLSGSVSRVILVATDSIGNQASDTITFTKLSDTTAPTVKTILAGKVDTVDNGTATYLVGWTVEDSGIVSFVKIRDKNATLTDTAYTYLVDLEVGSNVIWMEAGDQAGNKVRDTVVIVRRAPDTTTQAMRALDRPSSKAEAARGVPSRSAGATLVWAGRVRTVAARKEECG